VLIDCIRRMRAKLISCAVCCLLLTSCQSVGDPPGGLAATKVNGSAAAKLPACAGARLKSLTVDVAANDPTPIWGLQAATPQPIQQYYVLGQAVAGYQSSGAWSVSDQSRNVVIVAELDSGVRMSTTANFGLVHDGALYINGSAVPLSTLNRQIKCAHA